MQDVVSGRGFERLAAAWKRLPLPYELRAAVSPTLNAAQIAILRAVGAPRPRPLSSIPPGPLILSGFFHDVLGLGSAARATLAALERYGLPANPHDIGFIRTNPIYRRARFPAVEPGGVWIAHCNPPELERLFWAFGRRSLENRYRIGYWAWELERLPKSWSWVISGLHEVWTPSSFTAAAVETALAKRGPDHVRVRVMPHPLPDLKDVRPDRAKFGIPTGRFVVLVMFDLRSTRARKNPDGALAAYLQAFPRDTGQALLLCKVVAGDAAPCHLQELLSQTAGRDDIRFLHDRLSDADVWSLIASVDVVLSLHRSEGYGLVLAEAMRLGTPVIATGWSGNMDFMGAESAALVPFSMIPIRDPQGQYRGPGRWADPDVTTAARHLAKLADAPAWREALAVAGRKRLEAHERRFFEELSASPWLDRVLARASLVPRLAQGRPQLG